LTDRHSRHGRLCGLIFFLNMLTYSQQSDYPVVKVGVILSDEQGRILLTRRAAEPFKDFWDIPGGTLEVADFNAETGACREIKEELGVSCELLSLVGIYSNPERDPRYHALALVYTGKITGGDIVLNRHVAEYAWFDPQTLPSNVGFEHSRILNDFKNKKISLLSIKRRIYAEYTEKPFAYNDARFKDRVRAASGAIVIKGNSILLAKRCREPFNGMWYIPGGHVLVRETMEETLVREIREELGVSCRVGKLFGVYSDRGRDPRNASVTAFYFTELDSERFEKNFEVNDFRYFSLSEVPELGYHQNIIIEDIKDFLSSPI